MRISSIIIRRQEEEGEGKEDKEDEKEKLFLHFVLLLFIENQCTIEGWQMIPLEPFLEELIDFICPR